MIWSKEVETSIMELQLRNSRISCCCQAERKKQEKKFSSKAPGRIMAYGHILFRLLSSRMWRKTSAVLNHKICGYFITVAIYSFYLLFKLLMWMKNWKEFQFIPLIAFQISGILKHFNTFNSLLMYSSHLFPFPVLIRTV